MAHRIIYVFHGRLPDSRAAAIFAIEEVKSLSAHAPVTMLVPLRDTTDLEAARRLYGLPESVELVGLPVVEWSRLPFLRRYAFPVSLLSFTLRLPEVLRRSDGTWVVTTDHLPALVASWCGKDALIEVHDFPTAWNPVWRLLLRRARIVLSTNEWKARELARRFGTPPPRIFVERNGIDLARFTGHDKGKARRALELNEHARIVLYTGALYPWKGVDTLIAAATLLPTVQVYIVGGADSHRKELRKKAGPMVRFVPSVPHEQVPLWQAAADVLVLPNTAHEELSAHYTSPMKLFEYMASGRPIAASDLPSIREILPQEAGYFFAPDDPQSLAETINRIFSEPDVAGARTERALRAVVRYAWDARAARIAKAMSL